MYLNEKRAHKATALQKIEKQKINIVNTIVIAIKSYFRCVGCSLQLWSFQLPNIITIVL